jgi:hypothetical protein
LKADTQEGIKISLAGGLRVTGTITDVMVGPDARTVLDVQYSRRRPSHQLGAAVRLAALQLAQPELTCRVVLGLRGEDESTSVQILELRGDPIVSARRILGMAFDVWAWTRHDAIPLFDRASWALANDGDVEAALEKDLKDNWIATLWGGTTADDLKSEPRCVSDPVWLPSGPRAQALATYVWSAYDDAVLDVLTASTAAENDEGGE